MPTSAARWVFSSQTNQRPNFASYQFTIIYAARGTASFSTIFKLNRFSGCNADPIYGKLQGYSDVPVINECTQSGHTPINIPGVFTGDLTCCSSDGCNDDGGAVPGDDGGNPGSGGSGGGPRGGHHNSAGASTFGLSLLTIVVAYFFSAIPV